MMTFRSVIGVVRIGCLVASIVNTSISADESANKAASPSQIKIINSDKGPPYAAKLPNRILSGPFHESLLASGKPSDPETYRLTYLPSFERPWMIRLTMKDGASGELVVKRLSGKGGYDVGHLERTITKALNGGDLAQLLSLLRRPEAIKPYGSLTGMQVSFLVDGKDGASWYYEAFSKGQYGCAYLNSPGIADEVFDELVKAGATVYKNKPNTKPFGEACMALIRAAELRVDPISEALISNQKPHEDPTREKQ
jgi:hypothetical protein